MAKACKRFLSPGAGRDYIAHPPRDLPLVVDEPETLELIASHSSIRDEPEAVSDGWLSSENLWVRVRLEDVAVARELRPQLTAQDRIRDIERRAKQAHRDLNGETRLMRYMLERAHAGGRRTPPRLLERLQAVEADLDGVPLA